MSAHTPVSLLPKLRSKDLIMATHEMPCSLRIASFLGRSCSGDVMAVHLDMAGGKGIGTKVSDIMIVAGCDACHRLLDGRDGAGWAILMERHRAAVLDRCIRALNETLSRLIGMGIIEVKGGRVI